MANYELAQGNTVRVNVEWRLQSTNALGNPTSSILRVFRPDGTQNAVTCTNTATGMYYGDFDLALEGKYRVQLVASGAFTATSDIDTITSVASL